MSSKAIVTIGDGERAVHICLEHDGQPERVGRRLVEAAQYAAPVAKFSAGDWAAAFLAVGKMARQAAGAPLAETLRIATDWKAEAKVAFRYEVGSDRKKIQVKVFGRDDPAAATPGPEKRLFDGTLDGIAVALKLPAAEPASGAYLLEILGTDEDLHQRILRATPAEAAHLLAVINALVKAKQIKSGFVMPVANYAPRFGEKDMIEQLGEHCGVTVVKRAVASVPAPKAVKA